MPRAVTAALKGTDAAVLVAHSNAGHYAPAAARAGRAAVTVFMDAALPPSAGRAALAPPELRRHPCWSGRGGHLHHLVDPAAVAGAVLTLASCAADPVAPGRAQ